MSNRIQENESTRIFDLFGDHFKFLLFEKLSENKMQKKNLKKNENFL